MVEMKESNIKWIGKIPMTWNLKKIKYLLGNRTENNNPIKSRDILSLTAKQGVIPLAEKEGGGNKPKEDYSAYRLAYPNDIVINSMNILSGSVGLSKYFGCVSPVYYMLYTLFKDDDIRFYHYIFQTTVFQKSLLGLGNGILIKESENGKLNTIRMKIPIDKLGNLYIPITSSEQQRTIADFLDEKCAEIDSISAEIQEQINTLEEYKKSVITEAVTKGLNPNVEMKESGIEWIRQIPKKWEIHPVYNYYNEGKNRNTYYKEDNLLSLSYGKIVRKNINTIGGLLPENFSSYNIIEADDIIIRPTDLQNDKRSLRTGLATEKGIITSAYIDLKPKANINSHYIHYLLHTYDIQKVFYNMGNGVRQGLSYAEFSKLKLLIPSDTEQELIANYLDTKCSAIDKIIKDKQMQLNVLEEYKKTIIYEYVTGKKEVA